MKKKNITAKKIQKIIKEKIKNPDIPIREISKKTNVSKSSVDRLLKQNLGQIGTKSDYIAKILDSDKEIMNLANEVIISKIKFIKEIQKVDNREVWIDVVEAIVDIAEKSFKRYTLLKWNITDSEGGLKSLDDFKKLSDDDLLNFLKN